MQKDGNYKSLLPQIIQYLLHQRKNGFWRNTVESATISNTLLPYILQEKTSQPVTINISGDTNFAVQSFPFTTKISSSTINKISINKLGAGIVYFTAFQKYWNTNPVSSNKNFAVKTVFQQNENTTTTLQKGQKTKLVATIENKEDAEYVMVEIPIPAGCVYANKNQSYWGWQKEFFKNKMMIFIENLPKGSHNIEIDLECRYGGVFTLNPAKAELMYFPTFFGRDEIKKGEYSLAISSIT